MNANINPQRDLVHNLFFPVIVFAALGGMTWAVRGSSGYGGGMGCVFAGVLWGSAWWFMAREPGKAQTRRYSSGWIIFTVTLGMGIAGSRGWAQWPQFFDGRLYTNWAEEEFVAISPAYGFLWMFIAGIPWAGISACMLAWCANDQQMNRGQWVLRIGSGIAGIIVARILFSSFPGVFLPLYSSMEAEYNDLAQNPNLGRLINDNRLAIAHMGLYLGFLSYECGRRDWKNVTLILTVGLVNGIGWATLQNWKWAPGLWSDAHFNWWRCWESCGGISIGVAYGIAWYLVNRGAPADEKRYRIQRPNRERLGAYLGLILGLGLSIRSGLKGWANIYLGNEDYWSSVLWTIIGPLMLLALLWLVFITWRKPLAPGYSNDIFPRAGWLMVLVVVVQNILAQLVTGPLTNWGEMVFNLYYLLLFFISAVVLYHYHYIKKVI